MAGHIGIAALSPEGSAFCYRTIGRRAAEVDDPERRPLVTLHNRPFSTYVEALERGDWETIAGLLQDLDRRGLLDETLVVWTGEFGRQPTAEYAKGTGRDHNSYGFTLWMAGGGIRGGEAVGATDELGSAAVVDRMHVKNLHATILTQLGFDPNRLSFRHGGLDQRLVGVEGAEAIHGLI